VVTSPLTALSTSDYAFAPAVSVVTSSLVEVATSDYALDTGASDSLG
jgi:hypothetical protein